MSRFSTCPSCGGLSPGGPTVCLHCDAPLRAPRFGQVARALGRAVLGTGALVTLMACYGMMMRRGDQMARCGGDGDRDEVCADQDCDDTRPDVYPGAADPDLDGIDQNCDGVDGWRDPATVAADPPPAAAADPSAAPPPNPPAPAGPPAIATDPP
jgi:hypothetical protein